MSIILVSPDEELFDETPVSLDVGLSAAVREVKDDRGVNAGTEDVVTGQFCCINSKQDLHT